MGKIAESVIGFAIYENATEFLGLADVQLPKIAQMVQEVTGSGIAGKYEAVLLGQFETMSTTINFRNMTEDTVMLVEPREHKIEVCAATQTKNTASGSTTVDKTKHVMVVRQKMFDMGKIATATSADANGEYTVTYYAFHSNGKKTIEVDVQNCIFMVNGVDYLADFRAALGK